MAGKKILLFESDAAFATELRAGFSGLGAVVEVVDDGNAGLEKAKDDRPDLILLCIELPRMNGFSVCNKLKKNTDLKDIPLVIMSSEATEETFEQHRKLRTRAEDYIRKPFSFEELLAKVSALVPFDSAPAAAAEEETIAIDEEIAIDDLVSLEGSSEDEAPPVEEPPPPAAEEAPAANVDAEVDAFAEKAFDALMMGGESAVPEPKPEPKKVAPPAFEDTTAVKSKPTKRDRIPTPPPRERVQTPAPVAPPEPARAEPSGPGAGEVAAQVAALQEEMEELREKAGQVDSLRRAAAEGDRFKAEVEELKKKVAKGGGPSSREFLDLREQLNKKDKEILDLKDAVNHRDKQILDVRDRLTAIEREKTDMEEKYEEATTQLGEARDRSVGLEQDKDTVSKKAADLQGRLERAQSEAEKTYKELEEQKRRRDALQSEKDGALKKAEADKEAALAALSERKDGEALGLLEKAENDALKAKADALAGLHRQHDEEAGRLRRELETTAAAAQKRLQAELAEAEEKRKTDLRLAADAKQEEIEAAAQAAAQRLGQREVEIAAKAEGDLRAVSDKHGREMAVLGGKLADAEERLAAVNKDLAAERALHKTTQGSLGDRERELEASRQDAQKTRASLEDAKSKLDGLTEDHRALEERNATNEERALRAMQRIKDDAAVIEKAKKALAIGLALLDEQSEKAAE